MSKRPVEKKPKTQMVRLNARLWDLMRAEGALNDRTPRQEIEHRVQHSLAGGGDAQPSLSWGRALGRLVAILADDVERYSHRPEEAFAKMQAAAPTLFEILADHIRDAVKQDKRELSEEERAWAISQAALLAGKVKRAHLTRRRMEELTTSAETREEKELRMLQEALSLSPEALRKMSAPPPDQPATKSKKK